MIEFRDVARAQDLALAIVDTLPEPFLVLDGQLRLLAGSRCFYEVFHEDPENVHGLSLFDLSEGQWDIPGLRRLLAAVATDHVSMERFEFEAQFAHLGQRNFQLNAHPLRYTSGGGPPYPAGNQGHYGTAPGRPGKAAAARTYRGAA